jgi:deoxyadenosine/deoxycytidine kinase
MSFQPTVNPSQQERHKQNCFVVIAGNIGVGKSTLTQLLADRLAWTPFFEPNAENPYLADFYDDMLRWSFHSQVFFLAQRVVQHKQLLERGDPVVLDRSIYEDAEIFACNLYRRGAMSARDWHTYETMYRTMSSLLRPPDLVVYLRADVPTLLQRIAQRGRDYERAISADYLASLNALYDEWAQSFTASPVLSIETNALDVVNRTDDLSRVIDEIQKAMVGCV